MKKQLKKTKERKCLKFTGYIYLPKDEKDIKYHACNLGVGRLQIYDECNNLPAKAIACDIGSMLALITNAYWKRATKNLQKIGLLHKSPNRKKTT